MDKKGALTWQLKLVSLSIGKKNRCFAQFLEYTASANLTKLQFLKGFAYEALFSML